MHDICSKAAHLEETDGDDAGLQVVLDTLIAEFWNEHYRTEPEEPEEPEH